MMSATLVPPPAGLFCWAAPSPCRNYSGEGPYIESHLNQSQWDTLECVVHCMRDLPIPGALPSPGESGGGRGEQRRVECTGGGRCSPASPSLGSFSAALPWGGRSLEWELGSSFASSLCLLLCSLRCVPNSLRGVSQPCHLKTGIHMAGLTLLFFTEKRKIPSKPSPP